MILADPCVRGEELTELKTDMKNVKEDVQEVKEEIKCIRDIYQLIYDISSENKVIMKTLEVNNKVQTQVVEDVKDIKNIMGTKESIGRLHNKVEDVQKQFNKTIEGITETLDTLESEVTTVKNKPANDALDTQKKIKWLLLSSFLLFVLSAFWDKIILLFG